MTLITWAITPEYAVVVSDRRVTRMRGGRAVSFEDEAMKTFLLNGQLLMGYTGLAEVGGTPMDFWVAELLAGDDPLRWPEILCEGMQEYYRKTPASEESRTTLGCWDSATNRAALCAYQWESKSRTARGVRQAVQSKRSVSVIFK
jgi:hypothetical protein